MNSMEDEGFLQFDDEGSPQTPSRSDARYYSGSASELPEGHDILGVDEHDSLTFHSPLSSARSFNFSGGTDEEEGVNNEHYDSSDSTLKHHHNDLPRSLNISSFTDYTPSKNISKPQASDFDSGNYNTSSMDESDNSSDDSESPSSKAGLPHSFHGMHYMSGSKSRRGTIITNNNIHQTELGRIRPQKTKHRRTTSADFNLPSSFVYTTTPVITSSGSIRQPNSAKYHHGHTRSCDNVGIFVASSPSSQTIYFPQVFTSPTLGHSGHSSASSSPPSNQPTTFQIYSQSLPSTSFIPPQFAEHYSVTEPKDKPIRKQQDTSSDSSRRSYSVSHSHVNYNEPQSVTTETPKNRQRGHRRTASATNIYFTSPPSDGSSQNFDPTSPTMQLHIVTGSSDNRDRRTTTVTVLSPTVPNYNPGKYRHKSRSDGNTPYTIEESDEQHTGDEMFVRKDLNQSELDSSSPAPEIHIQSVSPNVNTGMNDQLADGEITPSKTNFKDKLQPLDTTQDRTIVAAPSTGSSSGRSRKLSGSHENTRTSVVVQMISVKWNDSMETLKTPKPALRDRRRRSRRNRIIESKSSGYTTADTRSLKSVVVNKRDMERFALAEKKKKKVEHVDVSTQTYDDHSKDEVIVKPFDQKFDLEFVEKGTSLNDSSDKILTSEEIVTSSGENSDNEKEPYESSSGDSSDGYGTLVESPTVDQEEYIFEIDGYEDQQQDTPITFPMTFVVTKTMGSHVSPNTSTPVTPSSRNSTIIQIPHFTVETFNQHTPENFSDYTHLDNAYNSAENSEDLNDTALWNEWFQKHIVETNTTLDELKKKIIEQKFVKSESPEDHILPDVSNIVLKYRDCEGDLVTIRTTEELKTAFMEFLQEKKKRAKAQKLTFEELPDSELKKDDPVFELEAHLASPEDHNGNDSDASSIASSSTSLSYFTSFHDHDPFIVLASNYVNENERLQSTAVYLGGGSPVVVIQQPYNPHYNSYPHAYPFPLHAHSNYQHVGFHNQHIHGSAYHSPTFQPHFGHKKSGMHKSFSEDDMFKSPPNYDRTTHDHISPDRSHVSTPPMFTGTPRHSPTSSESQLESPRTTSMTSTMSNDSTSSLMAQQGLWYRNILHFSSMYCPSYEMQQKIFDTIQVGKKLGKGGFSTVFSIYHLTTGQMFAMKVCYLEQFKKMYNSSSYELIFEKIINEIKILEEIGDHPNIVKFIASDLFKYKLIKEDKEASKRYRTSDVAMIMELVHGDNLSHVVRHSVLGRLHENIVRLYAKQLIEALVYLHNKDIVHGDLSPYNIMITRWGEVKLIDFGLSKKISKKEQSPTKDEDKKINGTPMYIAPEALAATDQGKPSDIWSLGCIIVEAITGRDPYPHYGHFGNPLQIFLQILTNKDIPYFTEAEKEKLFISADAISFVDKCLKWNANERSTAEELLNHPFLKPMSDDDVMNMANHFKSKEQHLLNMIRLGTLEPQSKQQGSNESVNGSAEASTAQRDEDLMSSDSADENVDEDADLYTDSEDENVDENASKQTSNQTKNISNEYSSSSEQNSSDEEEESESENHSD